LTGSSRDRELERLTLRLVNMVVHSEQSRTYLRRVKDVTGLQVPPSDIRIIMALNGASASVSDVALGLGVDIAHVSRRAARLHADGLVHREKDPEDRRRILLSLTVDAQHRVDRWLDVWLEDYLAPVREWDDEALEQLALWFEYVHDRLAMVLPRVLIFDASSAPFVARRSGGVRQRFARAASRLIHWVERSRGFNDWLESVGEPMSQHAYFTLRVVMRDGPLAIGEVAAAMGLDHSQASKRLSHLHAMGLVDRSSDGADRRSSLIQVSHRGRELIDRLNASRLDGLVTLLTPIDDADRAAFTPLMERYVRMLAASDTTDSTGPDG
jgi:DNA-binding MarR family transcriptional regulator